MSAITKKITLPISTIATYWGQLCITEVDPQDSHLQKGETKWKVAGGFIAHLHASEVWLNQPNPESLFLKPPLFYNVRLILKDTGEMRLGEANQIRSLVKKGWSDLDAGYVEIAKMNGWDMGGLDSDGKFHISLIKSGLAIKAE